MRRMNFLAWYSQVCPGDRVVEPEQEIAGGDAIGDHGAGNLREPGPGAEPAGKGNNDGAGHEQVTAQARRDVRSGVGFSPAGPP